MRKNILITGASSGVGRQLAIKFAQHNFDLSLCGRQEGKLKTTLEQLRENANVYSESFCLSQTSKLTKFVTNAQKQLGGIDILYQFQ